MLAALAAANPGFLPAIREDLRNHGEKRKLLSLSEMVSEMDEDTKKKYMYAVGFLSVGALLFTAYTVYAGSGADTNPTVEKKGQSDEEADEEKVDPQLKVDQDATGLEDVNESKIDEKDETSATADATNFEGSDGFEEEKVDGLDHAPAKRQVEEIVDEDEKRLQENDAGEGAQGDSQEDEQIVDLKGQEDEQLQVENESENGDGQEDPDQEKDSEEAAKKGTGGASSMTLLGTVLFLLAVF